MAVLARSLAEALPRWAEPASTWQTLAACRGIDVAVFFPPHAGSYTEARAICGRCSVVDECRQMADRAEADVPAAHVAGMFAGETPSERIARRRYG